MKLTVVLSAAVIASAQAMDQRDECSFLGLRYAKTTSWCQNWVCQKISWNADRSRIVRREDAVGTKESISCFEAADFGSRELDKSSKPLKRSIQTVRAAIKQAMQRTITPGILAFLAVGVKPSPKLLRSMAGVYHLVSRRPMLLDSMWSQEVVDVLRLFRIELSALSNDPIDAQIFHWLFDTLAVGKLPLSSNLFLFLRAASVRVLMHPPIYRKLAAKEDRKPFDDSPSNFLLLAKTIDEVPNSLTPVNVQSFLNLVPSFLSAQRDSAAFSLIEHSIRKSICPKLGTISTVAVDPTILELVPFCSASPDAAWALSWRFAAASMNSRPVPSNRHQTLELLQERYVDLKQGMSALTSEPEVKYAEIAAQLLRDSISGFNVFQNCQTKPAFKCLKRDNKKKLRAFGRAIGLFLRDGEGKLKKFLEFWDPVQFRALHRGAIKDTAHEFPEFLAKKAFYEILEPLFHVRAGIDDVIGALGIEFFTVQEWTSQL
jgi:hypothetical protein